MSDFIAALGLFFALEGLVLAAFPHGAKHMMKTVLATPNGQLRIASSRPSSACLSSGWSAAKAK